MGTVLQKLQVIISASTRPLRDALTRVNNALRNSTRQVNRQTSAISNAFKSMGKAVAAALSIAAIVAFCKSCIELGSDLSEVQNVVDTTFGESSQIINEFAKNAITQFGLSELSAKQFSSTVGAMLKSMGLTSDKVLEMSTTITGLAGDMASFYNLSGADAFAKIRAGISGETEPLKQLGINLSVANLEAYALSQGITTAYSAMSQADQAILRYNYLLSVTKDAQGDFAKTSDSWANQTKILSERFNSLKASIGQGLINVLTPVLRVINTLISRLAVAAEAFKQFTDRIYGVTDNSGSGQLAKDIVAASVETDTMSDDMNNIAKAAQKAKGALAGFDKLNNTTSKKDTSSNASGSTLELAESGYNNAATKSVEAVTKGTSKIKGIISKLTKWLTSNFGVTFFKIRHDAIKNFDNLEKIFRQIWSNILTLKSPVIHWFNVDFTPYVGTILRFVAVALDSMAKVFNTVFSSIWNVVVFPVLRNFLIIGLPMLTQFSTQSLSVFKVFISEINSIYIKLWKEGIEPTLAIITGIWIDCVDTLATVWNQKGEPIFTGIKLAIHNTGEIIKDIWDKFIEPVWDNFMKTIDKLWSEHLRPFVENIELFAAEFVDCALTIYNKFISPLVKWIVDVFGPPVAKIFNTIIGLVGALLSNIIDTQNGIVTSLRGVIQFIKGVFSGDWSMAWEGIKKIFKGIWDSFVGIAKVPLNLLIGIINIFLSRAESAINVVIRSLNKINVKIPDWVPEFGGESFGINLKKADFGSIAYLAKGGIVNRATLSVIGEAGKEAVVPLENNTGWMDKLATRLSSKMDSSGIINAINRLSTVVGDGNIYLTAELDGDVAYKYMVKRNKQHVKMTGISEFVY